MEELHLGLSSLLIEIMCMRGKTAQLPPGNEVK